MEYEGRDLRALGTGIVQRTWECGDGHWAAKLSQDVQLHLAILTEPYISKIFSGVKTLESRFSRNKTVPYNRVRPGDRHCPTAMYPSPLTPEVLACT